MRWYASTTFFTGTKDNIKHLFSDYRFEFIRHDLVNPILLEVDEIYNLACPASPIHYQYNPVKDGEDQRHGDPEHAGPGQKGEGPHTPGLHLRGIRRPNGCTPQPETYWEKRSAALG